MRADHECCCKKSWKVPGVTHSSPVRHGGLAPLFYDQMYNRRTMKAVVVLLAIVSGIAVLAGQAPLDAKLQAELKKLFPTATAFSPKEGDPPHFTALAQKTPLGYAFWTTELEPLERGYDGPIKMLVGMDLRGMLTGIVVVEHHEPYGNFSVEPPEFAN